MEFWLAVAKIARQLSKFPIRSLAKSRQRYRRPMAVWHPFSNLRTYKALISLGSLVLVGPVAYSQTQESHGSFLIENGKLRIVSGVVIREIPSEKSGVRPLIAVGSADGIHHLYDPNTFAIQAVWPGSFAAIGPGGDLLLDESQFKRFMLRDRPWTFGERPRRNLEHRWRGYEVRNGIVFYSYQLSDEASGMRWEIEEHLQCPSESQQKLLFDIQPSGETEEYLNYWVKQTHFRRLSTNGQQNQRNLLKNLLPNQEQFTISFYRRKEGPILPHGYHVSEIPIPTPEYPHRFEPTDIDFGPDGSVFTSHRTGSVWRLKDGEWSLFAEGLHEAIGVRVDPEGRGVYVMQRPELTLLTDTDGDGVADRYATIEDRFRYTGHYHEFAYGPRISSKGELYFSTGLSAGATHHVAAPDGYPSQMSSALGYRGWVMKRNPDETLTPFASGLRSPAGIGINAKDELFVTDNQGDWVASSYLAHVEAGDFLGHPASYWDRSEFGITPRVLDYRTVGLIPKSVPPLNFDEVRRNRKPPAVWLAHGDLTNSPGHPSFAPPEGFGPFAGQAFIADISHRAVIRVALEKVQGAYQGAAFPFIRPLKSSSYSSAFDAEGNLWIGSVGRGWTPGEPAIEIISYDSSRMPFEMQRIELTEDGFDVHFTQPLKSSNIDIDSIGVQEFRYQYWDTYGSEPFDEAPVPVRAASVSKDKTKLSITVSRKEGYVYYIELPELRSSSGLSLDNNYGVYTLNQLLP